MASVLLDTHVWAWSLVEPGRISAAARTAIELADAVYVSPISFFEIGQKVRLGKWPEMAPHAERLPEVLRGQGAYLAPMTGEICLKASLFDWTHRDPFDRLLAATVQVTGDGLVSADGAFDGVPGGVRRIW